MKPPVVEPALPNDRGLHDALCQWWQQERRADAPRLRQLDRRQQTYSALSVWELEEPTGGDRQTLVCKRVIHQECNAIYGEPAQLLRAEFAALQSASHCFRSQRRYGVPTPRLLLPHLDTVVMDFAPGRCLESLLSGLRYTAGWRAQRQLERWFWQLGRWLHHYQANGPLEVRGPEALRTMLDHCAHRLDLVERTGHAWLPPQLRARVLQRLGHWQQSLSGDVRLGPCHGDFGPWNVLVAASRLTVLDFSLARQDSVLLDPLGVLVYLESLRHSPSLSGRRVRRLQQVFLRGYACAVNPPWPLVAVCESLQRICRLQDCLLGPTASIVDRHRRWRVFRENLHYLLHSLGPQYGQLVPGHSSGQKVEKER